MPRDRHFALRLMLAMEARGLNQSRLARMIGSSKSVVCDLMKGNTHPSYETLVSLASNLKVSADYLCGLEKK